MAIKLKNINKSKGIRTVAFLLAALLFASSGYFASMFFKSEFVYNSFDNRPFTQTSAFRIALNEVEHAAIYEGQVHVIDNIEEFEQTSYGRSIKDEYDLKKQTAEKSYDLLDSSDIGIYVTKTNKYRYRLEHNDEVYYFTYDGSQISEDEFNSYTYIRSNEFEGLTKEDEPVVSEQSAADSVQSVGFEKPETVMLIAPVVEDVTEPVYDSTTVIVPDDEINRFDGDYIGKISDALNFIFHTTYNGYNLNYGEVSRDAFMVSIENDYREALEESFRFHKSGVLGYFALDRLPSLRYAVKFKNSGKVFTNSGVSPSDSRDAIVQKLGGELVDSFENGKYIPPVKQEEDNTALLAQLYYELLEGENNSPLTYLSTVNGETIDCAYFSYNPIKGEGDVITASEILYNEHSDKEFKAVAFCLPATLIFFALACAVGIYLIASAGKTDNGEVKLCFYDRIPFELNLALGIGVMALCVYGVIILGYNELDPTNLVYSNAFIIRVAGVIGTASSSLSALLAAIFFMIPTSLLMSIARNVRAKTFVKHTLCRYIFMPVGWLFKKLKTFSGNLKYIFAADYSGGKTKKFKIVSAVSVAVFFVINALLGFFALAFGGEEGLVLLIIAVILDLAAIFYCILIIVSVDRIMHTVSDIRSGKTDAKINVERMPLFLKKFSEDITSIGDGLKDAVDSAVKDQRMKAELITNVSHDLKTPLTSIVSYVDLLKRCNVEGEDANRYISILDEKAHRMKKLIEDLVEASKASSGAMEIHPIRINLCEFAAQAVGEHEDELKSCGIDVVLSIPNVHVNVMADPMKISRVVENLFSNIRKYALEGTRVYADVSEKGEYAVLTLKNISKNALNVPAEELMQRFVRGDSSRTGEGSGLGLSIAKNLCELQKGKFSISVDGDLFKAVVELPKA